MLTTSTTPFAPLLTCLLVAGDGVCVDVFLIFLLPLSSWSIYDHHPSSAAYMIRAWSMITTTHHHVRIIWSHRNLSYQIIIHLWRWTALRRPSLTISTQFVTGSEWLLSLIGGQELKSSISAAFWIKFRPSLQNFKIIVFLRDSTVCRLSGLNHL